MDIGHKIITLAILLLPLIQEGLLSVTSEGKYVHELLVKSLVKLTQEQKVLSDELTVSTQIFFYIHCLRFNYHSFNVNVKIKFKTKEKVQKINK